MIEEVTMYRVRCDRCGKRDETDDYFAWAEAEQAEYSADASEWLITGTDVAAHHCPNCIEWDEEADEMRPKATAQRGGAEG